MSRIFDKLGIYDLVAVLLSGICITTFSLFVDQIVVQSQLSIFLKVEDTFSYLVISYFVGLVFQELSSLIHKQFIYKGNKLLLQVLNTSKKSHQTLTQEEKDGIIQIVQTELSLKTPPNEEIVYNYCKYYLIANEKTERADKDQSTFGMSRSMSLYLFGLSLFTACSAIMTHHIIYLICAVVIVALSVLLYFRCIRFAKMRYIHILRFFYYSFQRDMSEKARGFSNCVMTDRQ